MSKCYCYSFTSNLLEVFIKSGLLHFKICIGFTMTNYPSVTLTRKLQENLYFLTAFKKLNKNPLERPEGIPS
jgi:hypothetical protein